jgi:trigger factor
VKSAVETLNPTRVKLTVEVPFEELKPSLDAAYRTISRQVNIPGFRKGKVPPRIIDQRVGRGVVLEEAVNEALPKFYLKAVQEGEFEPLGQPHLDVTEVPDPSVGGDLKFTAEVDVRPTLTLPDLESPAVTVDDAGAGEEQVDERVEALRARFGTLLPVERPVSSGDFVTLAISATIDGDEIDSVTDVSYEVGSGQMLPGMDEVLPDLSAGEVTTFTAPLAGGDRSGEEAVVTVTVQAVKERELPTLDDDFAQLASEFDTLEELRADLRTQVERTVRYQQLMQARDRLMDFLLEAVEVPVPDALVESEVVRHLEAEERLEDDEHRAEVRVEALKAIQAQFLLDALAEREKVTVSQSDLIEYLVANAAQYRMDPQEFAEAVDKAGQIPSILTEVARRKALASLLDRTVITDASGAVVDMTVLNSQQDEDEDEEFEDEEFEGEEFEGEAGAARREPTPVRPAPDDPTALPVL